MGEYTGYIATHAWPAPLSTSTRSPTGTTPSCRSPAAANRSMNHTPPPAPVYAAEALHQLRSVGLPVTACFLPLQESVLKNSESYGFQSRPGR